MHLWTRHGGREVELYGGTPKKHQVQKGFVAALIRWGVAAVCFPLMQAMLASRRQHRSAR
jgi:hypothetical protein